MQSIHKILAFLLLCMISIGSFAAKPYQPIAGDIFEESWRWTDLDILSPYVVRQAAKAPDGVLWFAVHGGVVAYDGYSATPHMFVDTGWEESNTLSIYVASNGIVYVATKDFGACLEDGRWTRLFETDVIGYSSGSRIDESLDTSIWFATPSGLFRARGTTAEKVNLESEYFSSVMIDRFNRMWLADSTRKEILRYELDPGSGLPMGDPFRLPTRGISGTLYIVEFAQGAGDRVWIAANSNKHALRKVEEGTVTEVLENWSEFGPPNRYLLERPDGTLWVITQALIAEYTNGVWTFNDMRGQATWFSFMYAYDEDTLILGGHTDNTYRFDASEKRWKTYDGLNFQCRDASGIDWFVTKNKRIVRFDERENSWTSYGKSDGVIDQPTRIISTKNGYLWASGSHDGVAAVSWYKDEVWSRRRHGQFSTTIAYHSPFEGADGIVYYGADIQGPGNDSKKGGILKYWIEDDRVESSYEFPPSVPERILHIAQTPDQNLWIGNGPSLMKKEGNQRAQLEDERFQGNWIDNLSVDSDGNLWVLAWRTGVSRLSEGEWERFTLPEHRRSNKAAALFAGPGDQNVWVATNEGLSRFDNHSWFEHSRLPELNLVRNECKLIGSSDGSLWVNIAVNDWYGNSVPYESHQEAPFKTVRYSAGDQPPNTEIVLATKSMIESGNALIEWSGVDAWSETPKVDLHYSYRINSGPWSPYQTNPQALLESVESGEYTFEVRARDLDWNQDPSPAVLNFTVKPFLWKQPWFILLVFSTLATIIGLITYIVRMRVNHIIAIEEFKIDFFTNISHELRTPLSSIIGPLESMLKKPAAEPLKGSLNMVYRNARRMLGLVNQLLEFRKVELGKLKYEPVRSDLILFLKDVIYAHANLWERKEQQFQLNSKLGHKICCFDPEKLQHIVTNLMSNAIKYSDNSGNLAVTIEFFDKNPCSQDNVETIVNSQDSPEWLSVEVVDNGIGIAKDRHELIFKPFYRERDHDRDHQGSGIGLAYIYELVNLWGGTIEVESPITEIDGSSKGTRFRVCLPLIEGETASEMISSFVADPVQPEPVAEVEGDADNSDQSEPATILIVDDNADIREFLESELNEQYKILSAENGQEGLDVAQDAHPDLILADLMMPVMDGLEMCSRLKTNPETSHIPVLVLTARRSDEFRIKGIEHGADDYYAKPVNIELLKARIKSLMESRRLLRERFTRQVLIQPEEITVTPLDEQFLRKSIKVVQEHMRDEDFDVEAFSREMGMGRASLYRKMNAIVGEPPFKFIRSIRLKRAAQLLESGNFNVSETMEQIGINGLSHFGKIFRDEYGEAPSEYRSRYISDGTSAEKRSSVVDELL